MTDTPLPPDVMTSEQAVTVRCDQCGAPIGQACMNGVREEPYPVGWYHKARLASALNVAISRAETAEAEMKEHKEHCAMLLDANNKAVVRYTAAEALAAERQMGLETDHAVYVQQLTEERERVRVLETALTKIQDGRFRDSLPGHIAAAALAKAAGGQVTWCVAWVNERAAICGRDRPCSIHEAAGDHEGLGLRQHIDVGARYTSSAALQNAVVDHLAVAEERVRVLEAALEAVEWVEDTYASDQNLDPVLICPWCGGTGTVVEPRPYILYPKGPPEPPRHKPDCKRQAALAKARREI